jgi:transforming growth factor-beta-induced protein
MMRLALVLVGVACVVAKTQNIVQLAQATPDLSTLVTALTAGGLTETLSGKGPFTVFAPTNEAFAKIETKALNALLQNKAELDKVLEYHVLAADLRMRELMAVKIVKTLEGEYVDVSDPGGVIKVNNAKVLTSDVAASNGFVHIIDTVLMTPSGPPLNITKDIVHVAQGNADLSTLVAALTAGKLVATLEGKGPFTVFAPTNKAFAKIPKHTLTKLLGNQKLLDQLLEYHVVSGDWSTRAMIGEMKSMYKYDFLPTLEKEDVIVRSMNNAIMVNNANVVLADVEATNGVVHVVDKVLVPPNFPLALYPLDIVELSESQLSLPTFVQALVAGKLTATLSGKGPYTVFAPTNDAFFKIPAADLQRLLANPTELDKVLEYHVLAGKLSMRDLMSVLSAKTLEGQNLKVSGSGKVINVNDAKVLKADVEASNGVVHVIDTVLMPPNAPSPAWKPCSSTSRTCCNPFTSPQQICQNWKKSGGAKCQACGGGNACECPQADVMV